MIEKHSTRRRRPTRIVLFGSKGKASKNIDANGDQETNADTEHQKIIDFSALALWYSEQKENNSIGNEWSVSRVYAEKQNKLRFLTQ
ncbi:MAG: hypothetical protein FWH57_00640 [Oscillospiraceae bacterium]|nr:hypothetical protein [Oscillospiraceae bacterium]